MNVTLTFNVFFGPLAIAALVGCGPMKNYEFNQIDQTIDLEQSKLFHLEYTLSEIDTEKSRLIEFLDYANSPAGRQYYLNAQCESALPAAIQPALTPAQRCEARVRSAEQHGECAITVRDGTQLNGSVTLEEAVSGLVCFTGATKLPKWLRIPTPAKLAFSGALQLARSASCTSTLSVIKQHTDNPHSNNATRTSDCEAEFQRCKSNEIARLNQIAQATKISQRELQHCESTTNRFPGLTRSDAQNRISALEKRAQELGSDIQLAYTAIFNAQAHKVSANKKHSGDQQYTPPDPG